MIENVTIDEPQIKKAVPVIGTMGLKFGLTVFATQKRLTVMNMVPGNHIVSGCVTFAQSRPTYYRGYDAILNGCEHGFTLIGVLPLLLVVDPVGDGFDSSNAECAEE